MAMLTGRSGCYGLCLCCLGSAGEAGGEEGAERHGGRRPPAGRGARREMPSRVRVVAHSRVNWWCRCGGGGWKGKLAFKTVHAGRQGRG